MTPQKIPKQHSEKKLNETLTHTLAEILNWHPKEALNETWNPKWSPKETLNETLKKPWMWTP
jgi:outer membrane receptor for ferrienterochelin and colicin